MVQRSVRVSGATFAMEAPAAAVMSDMLSKAPITLIQNLCIGLVRYSETCVAADDLTATAPVMAFKFFTSFSRL
ncbi:hypothetical protein MPL1032_160075 [Mesorhizobium plurifarium]|uniref:Uncharacterized protein n=1 Tax=Mesorhizobium plurifarium TaxID=69974 RepID=A0A0K2VTB5_MESPL|nr:hypothetical protein MPL1032_160075 [Mesorhizobium plurifarium]